MTTAVYNWPAYAWLLKVAAAGQLPPPYTTLQHMIPANPYELSTTRMRRDDRVAFRCASLVNKAILAAILVAMAGCATAPIEQRIAGPSPAGTVSVSEDFVVGWAGGDGLLNYQGRPYRFKFVCALLGPPGSQLAEVARVLGPGGGRANITAAGVVYKLTSVADFPGIYTHSIGASDSWLQNSAGVMMHLQGVRTGATQLIPNLEQVAIQVSD